MNRPFLDGFRSLAAAAARVLPDPRPREKFRQLAVALVCADNPKTITSGLDWLGQRQEDWSADHRLLSQARWDPQAVFTPVFRQALASPWVGRERVYCGQDDTLLRKTGRPALRPATSSGAGNARPPMFM